MWEYGCFDDSEQTGSGVSCCHFFLHLVVIAGLTAVFSSPIHLSKLCFSYIVSRKMSCMAPMCPSSVVMVKGADVSSYSP